MFPPNTKFLVIDDAASIVMIIKKCLNELGFESVDMADSGKSGLKLLKEAEESGKGYQVIISDLNMPQMNGLDLLEECSKDPKLSKIPFIMLTSEGQKDMVLQAVVLGVSDYLLKPFTTDSIREKLSKVFDRVSNKKS